MSDSKKSKFKDEYSGLWWLPQKPDRQVPGHLKFVSDRTITLELLGTLQESPHSNVDSDPPIILGITSSGIRITLIDCFLDSTTLNDNLYTSSLSAQKGFFGVHFEKTEDILFKNVSIHYANLDEWVNKRGFDINRVDSNELTVHYKRPESVKATVNGYEIYVGNAGPASSYDPLRKVSISQKAFISIFSEEERSFDDYFEIIRHIQNFLSLAMSAPTYPVEIVGKTNASKEVLENGTEFFTQVDVFYQPFFHPENKRNVHRAEMLFTLPSIEEKFEVYISNWLDKIDLLSPVYDLYFSTLYNSYLYLESEFLTLAQAIETYHRRRFGGKYQSDEEFEIGLYKKFVDVIPPEIDKGFKKSLKTGKLKYANEFSLRKRLQDIVDRLASNFAIEFIGLPKSRKRFAAKVSDTRNYLTHYSPELQEKAAEGSELIRLKERLRIILEICLIEEVGFDSKTIRELTTKNRRYKNIFEAR